MNKHTKGPWQQFTDTYEDGPRVSIGRALGEFCTPQYVAEVCGWGQDFESDAEQQANARLISAAPDLLTALEDLRKELRAHVKFDVKRHYSLMVADVVADKAIAKARGHA